MRKPYAGCLLIGVMMAVSGCSLNAPKTESANDNIEAQMKFEAGMSHYCHGWSKQAQNEGLDAAFIFNECMDHAGHIIARKSVPGHITLAQSIKGSYHEK